ncbi:ABC transporter substrate-binding protein [Rhodococcus olei]|uniref:ABC transporter substrate-binding protein n=1 Tax=Rhodococcus olei TaxID=2161675 RepID=UPI0031F11868
MALLTTATACGSGGATTQTADGLTKVAIGSMAANSLSFPYTIAQEQGFFHDAGLEVETVNATSGPQLTAALIGKSTQIAIGTPENAMAAMDQGQSLVAIPPFGRIDMVLVTPESSGITDVKSLQGKQIGVAARGSAAERFARTVLAGNGVDPDSVTYVAVGAGATMEPAVRAGKVDATVGATSTVVTMQDHGIPLRELANPRSGTAGPLGDYGLQTFWTTTRDFQQGQPQVLTGFCTAMNRASAWLADGVNRDAATQSLATFLQIPVASAAKIWDRTHTSWGSGMDATQWTANVDWVLGPGKNLPFDRNVLADCGH